MSALAAKLSLGNFPTPLWHNDRLDRLVGTEVWVKRDDACGGPEAGNKVRKLEYLLADAQSQGATTIITCGGIQSNHARSTAICAAGLGMGSVLMLRCQDPSSPQPVVGNLLLNQMVGADVRLITPAQYRERSEGMASIALELTATGKKPYIIPEGGSNALGSLGYVDAMAEVRAARTPEFPNGASFDAVVHACGSGGTAAGLALGIAHHQVATRVVSMAVCDDAAYFTPLIAELIAGARALAPTLPAAGDWAVEDSYKGPGYGIASEAQMRFIVDVARCSGLILDPVYSGKALFGLSKLAHKPHRTLFIHTGGLPGLLAQGEALAPSLGSS